MDRPLILMVGIVVFGGSILLALFTLEAAVALTESLLVARQAAAVVVTAIQFQGVVVSVLLDMGQVHNGL